MERLEAGFHEMALPLTELVRELALYYPDPLAPDAAAVFQYLTARLADDWRHALTAPADADLTQVICVEQPDGTVVMVPLAYLTNAHAAWAGAAAYLQSQRLRVLLQSRLQEITTARRGAP